MGEKFIRSGLFVLKYKMKLENLLILISIRVFGVNNLYFFFSDFP